MTSESTQISFWPRKDGRGKNGMFCPRCHLILPKLFDEGILPRLRILAFRNDLAAWLPFVRHLNLNVGTRLSFWDADDTVTGSRFIPVFFHGRALIGE